MVGAGARGTIFGVSEGRTMFRVGFGETAVRVGIYRTWLRLVQESYRTGDWGSHGCGRYMKNPEKRAVSSGSQTLVREGVS